MPNKKHWVLAAIVLLTSIFSTVAKAADVYAEGLTIYLDGEIRRGDAERVAIAVTETNTPYHINVSSMGGDINETMKIVSIVKGAHMEVEVARGKVCASSCFFVYLAGDRRVSSGHMVNNDGSLRSQERRNMATYGVVGIHRPYFKDPSGSPESQKQQIKLMQNVKKYLIAGGVPQNLIDEMMSHSSNDIYWLNEHDVDAIGEYPPNIEEILIARCGYKKATKIIEEGWSAEKTSEIIPCVHKAFIGMNMPLQTEYGAKLRTGWRPWLKQVTGKRKS